MHPGIEQGGLCADRVRDCTGRAVLKRSDGDKGDPVVAVWDCESDSLFQELPGCKAQQFSLMHFTCVAVFFVGIEDKPRIYERGMERQLIEALDSADVLVGYNLDFDLNLLKKLYVNRNLEHMWRQHCFKSYDLFDHIRVESGRWPKLDACCMSNLKVPKNAFACDGKRAVQLFHEGVDDPEKIKLLHEYCMADVVMTARLLAVEKARADGGFVVPAPVEGSRAFLRETGRQRGEEMVIPGFANGLRNRALGRTWRRLPTFSRQAEEWDAWETRCERAPKRSIEEVY